MREPTAALLQRLSCLRALHAQLVAGASPPRRDDADLVDAIEQTMRVLALVLARAIDRETRRPSRHDG